MWIFGRFWGLFFAFALALHYILIIYASARQSKKINGLFFGFALALHYICCINLKFNIIMDSEGLNVGKNAALAAGTMLRGGMYVIMHILGRGGFGITYLAEHVGLGKRVAIKEFFFGQFCERDENTSHVTVPTVGNRELVEKFRRKFVKEARLIGSKLSHPSIVNVSDVFDENGTSYYVMDYIDGLSLSEVIKRRGRINEAEAVRIIDRVGEALAYVHSQNINHLDIKPGNIMMENGSGRVVLIDFGVAKQYDASTGEATTTTPVGRSHGYSPLEQYKVGGVSQFSPESDIYALGATLYKMLTGNTPPEAGDVAQDGLPPMPNYISAPMRRTITAAMQTAKKDRPHTVAEFLGLLHGGSAAAEEVTEVEATVLDGGQDNDINENHIVYGDDEEDDGKKHRWLLWIVGAAVAVGTFVVLQLRPWQTPAAVEEVADTVAVVDTDSVVSQKTIKTPERPKPKLPVIEMVYIPGGKFTMGAVSERDSDVYAWELPAHTVTLRGYYIGKYEVTQKLWEAVMGNNPSFFKGDSQPVEQVSWNDVQIFIKKLNSITGKHYRLPTEAEWEYAARGGSKSSGYKYSGSDILDNVAWHKGNSARKTHVVGAKVPNELGIYDMSGNVWEWCYDWYGLYSNLPQNNPKGAKSGSLRVIRGSSWNFDTTRCKLTDRDGIGIGNRNNYVGFRLAL